MAPPARWTKMDSPVKPANDAKGGGLSAPPRHSGESRSPGNRRVVRAVAISDRLAHQAPGFRLSPE